jgi:hypothetical protein
VMDVEGNLQVKSLTTYRALSQDEIEDVSHGYTRDKQLDYLKSKLSLPTYTINSFDFKEDHSARIPAIRETLDISVSSYAHLTGRRIFINPNILGRSDTKLPDDKERKLDFQFKTEHSETDSVEIAIPSGYETESQPQDIITETKYGRYKTQSKVLTDKIIYYRRFEQYRGRFPSSEFEEVKKFYNGIYEADRTQIVLVKKN